MNKCVKCGLEFEGKFCPDCGEAAYCPKCGEQRKAFSNFCPECGYKFDSTRESTPCENTEKTSKTLPKYWHYTPAAALTLLGILTLIFLSLPIARFILFGSVAGYGIFESGNANFITVVILIIAAAIMLVICGAIEFILLRKNAPRIKQLAILEIIITFVLFVLSCITAASASSDLTQPATGSILLLVFSIIFLILEAAYELISLKVYGFKYEKAQIINKEN